MTCIADGWSGVGSPFAEARSLSATGLACRAIDGYTAHSGVGDSMGEL